MRNRTKEFEYLKKAFQVFPFGFVDSDPLTSQISALHPPFLERGKGAYVWDMDGNKYIDCGLCWGSIILGHADTRISEAIATQACLGTSLGVHSPLTISSCLNSSIVPTSRAIASVMGRCINNDTMVFTFCITMSVFPIVNLY